MKKFFAARRVLPAVFCALLSAVLPLTSCAAGNSRPGPGDSGGKLKVVASFYTMYDFCEKIGGDKISLACLTPAGAEPHDWEPSPTDMAAVENADVFVYHGGIEFWADRVLSAVRSGRLTVVRASDTAVPDGLGEGDPHVWLAPGLAKTELGAIAGAFAAADPANADFYEANNAAWAAEFDKLDEAYKDGLFGAAGKTIVVSHEAFGYLCAAYGLTQEAVEGLSPDSEPSAGRVAQIIDLMERDGIGTIFYEELTSSKAVGQIAEATGAEAVVLSPLEGLTQEEVKNGDDYVSVMYRNLEALKKAVNYICPPTK
ncbi:MAG: zinc ABC transporter substrate-binding protein [Firmicutes bacterium]|nr:zinc ABC transporter substrate-binding protein [Bacillota bacterium]